MITVAALAMGLGLAGASPGLADDAAGLSQPDKAKTDTSRKICRMVVPTGSRMTNRICRTQAEWDKAMDKTQQGVLRHQTTEQSGFAH
jgi:hypothetical protein